MNLPFIPGPRLVFYMLVLAGAVLVGLFVVLRESVLDLAGLLWGLSQNRSRANASQAATTDRANVAASLEQIGRHHPGFTPAGFLEDVKQTIELVQRARNERTPELVRDRLTAAAWLQLSRQVAQLSVSRDLSSGPMILKSAEIVAGRSDTNQDAITVRLTWKEDSSGAPLDRQLVRESLEDWTFGRLLQTTTAPVNPDFWLLVQVNPISSTLVPRTFAA